jgi:excinuclease UvrABC helicase subunit UvrB
MQSDEERRMTIERLEDEMLAAAGALDFERAAKLRDQMLSLKGDKPMATAEKSRLGRRGKQRKLKK